jgi:hypothetical protein
MLHAPYFLKVYSYNADGIQFESPHHRRLSIASRLAYAVVSDKLRQAFCSSV